jgi:hypothetical protein
MPQLKILQKYFLEAIFDNDIANLLESVKQTDLDKEQLINIYKNNVITTLCETLKNRYPVILTLTGEDFFKYASLKFIKHNQPKSGNLDEYGEEFIEFIDNLKEAENYKYLKDIARLEWATHYAYFVEDAPKIDIKELSATNIQKLQDCYFALHPSVHLIASSYAIDKIYNIANTSDYTSEFSDITKININKPTYILVLRHEYTVEYTAITIGEYHFLKSLAQKSKIIDAFNTAVDVDDRFDFAKSLHKFSLNGTFSNFNSKRFW